MLADWSGQQLCNGAAPCSCTCRSASIGSSRRIIQRRVVRRFFAPTSWLSRARCTTLSLTLRPSLLPLARCSAVISITCLSPLTLFLSWPRSQIGRLGWSGHWCRVVPIFPIHPAVCRPSSRGLVLRHAGFGGNNRVTDTVGFGPTDSRLRHYHDHSSGHHTHTHLGRNKNRRI